MTTTGQRPLDGVRVLDIGTLIAGPFGASLLADFGADVIKVEQPGTGDSLRTGGGNRVDGVSLSWIQNSRNKRSVTLNLREPEGQRLFLRLAAVADLVIENFTPGTLEKWNIGPDVLRRVNPRLVLLRVSGFGQTGPYSRRAGYDRIALGYSGLMYVSGYPDSPPVRPAFAMADFTTAMFGALSSLMALYHRDVHGGSGQVIDLALFEPIFRISEDLIQAYDRLGVVRERIGNRNPGFAPAGNFMTKDGRWLQIAAGGDRIWQRMAAAMGLPELATEERFANQRARAENADALEAIIRDWIAARDFEEAFRVLDEAGVPTGGIYNAAEIAADPHFAAREDIITLEHPTIGPVRAPGVVPKLSDTPGRVDWPGPDLGQHNNEIYADLLGLSGAELQRLRRESVV
ncbi:MAG: CaiB/BaiF CoA transferase family protein [Dehalococcoidia bacterium]